jgi:glycine/D-amino acid oxidase-like deaminating enzyme
MLRKHDPSEVTRINSFVTSVDKTSVGIEIQTVDLDKFKVDKVIFCGGNYNRYWKGLSNEKKLQSSSPVHGSYMEFDTDLAITSFSLTLEGHNLIYNHVFKKLIIGSTTETTFLQLPMEKNLREIYDFLKKEINLELPDFETGKMIVGLREKASKRTPYLFEEDGLYFFGGLYKNGYSLPIHMSKDLVMML